MMHFGVLPKEFPSGLLEFRTAGADLRGYTRLSCAIRLLTVLLDNFEPSHLKQDSDCRTAITFNALSGSRRR
jgi:hypothetical protein